MGAYFPESRPSRARFAPDTGGMGEDAGTELRSNPVVVDECCLQGCATPVSGW